MYSHGLHPWGIIFDFLMDLSADQICRIIDLTGLPVNWTSTPKQEYSDLSRKRAYRSKISNAYSQLGEKEKLLTAQNVVSHLSKYDSSEQLNKSLNGIGWKLDSGVLTSDKIDIIERFFPKGTQHDSYVTIRSIIHQASSDIIIIDPYLDTTILEMLGTLAIKPRVKILSYKLPSDFNRELKRFNMQHSEFQIEVRRISEFHDRFIIIDENECYHIGASIKDSGSKHYMINKIEDRHNRKALIEQFGISWRDAASI